MAEGSANKVSISDRDKKVIYIVAGLVIVALAYFLGFQKMMEQRSTIAAENVTLDQDVKKLQGMVADKAEVENNTEKANTETEKILARYPAEIRTQDVIYQLDLLEKSVKGLLLETESYTMNQVFFMNGAVTEGESQDVADESGEVATPTGVIGYRSNVSTNFTTNYESLEKIIDFINKNENRMNINSITVSQGEGAKDLTCNMNVNMYSIAGTEKSYEDPAITGVRTGKEGLFAEGK
ncbi:MAG: hypothetical protein Q4D32_07030 [Eubacteriales bacterium]|nr:hypothetical protein [Eubacteriales bacterium]